MAYLGSMLLIIDSIDSISNKVLCLGCHYLNTRLRSRDGDGSPEQLPTVVSIIEVITLGELSH